MASISVVLLGLNPETRLKSVVDYLKGRGVPGERQRPRGPDAIGCPRALGGVAQAQAAPPDRWGGVPRRP